MRAIADLAILFALAVVMHADGLFGQRAHRESDAPPSQHVILVVSDGLRWQEVFRGADSTILFGPQGSEVARRRFWRGSARARREALMPFLSRTVAREGMVAGNRDVGSVARVTNDKWFSYPGYNEMLVGFPDPRIGSNRVGPNPNVTVFEWLAKESGYTGRVAAFGMWDTFRDIFNVRRSGIPVQHFSTDAVTHAAALRHLERVMPGAMFVGYGATDDFAHKGRYDLVLDAAHAVDRYLAELWERAQATPDFRGRTTLIVVADHGRGRTARDWTDHNRDVPGSDETWIAMIGPGIGGGDILGPVTLSQVAATVAAAVGEDYRASVTRAAPALLPAQVR